MVQSIHANEKLKYLKKFSSVYPSGSSTGIEKEKYIQVDILISAP
jgi:hypothetical protein